MGEMTNSMVSSFFGFSGFCLFVLKKNRRIERGVL